LVLNAVPSLVFAIIFSCILLVLCVPLTVVTGLLLRRVAASAIALVIAFLLFSPLIVISFLILFVEPAACPPPPAYGIYCKGDPVPWTETISFLVGILLIGLPATFFLSRLAAEHFRR